MPFGNDITRLYDLYREHPRVTTDSRDVPEGSLFFALKGGNFDGNRFASDALAGGASYAIVDDPSAVADEYKDRVVLVGDSLRSLQDLAARHRRTLGIPVVAITGTNGKTTTKEFTAAVLSYKYKVYATRGNLNNHIGVPLTLLSITDDIEVAVVEMGASATGEIAALCRIAAPDYGLITNIGRAHLEGFGSADGIRTAKGELYDYLASHGGTAVVRKDDPVLMAMVAERPGLRAVLYDSSSSGGVAHNLAGGYNIYNIAAAIGLGAVFGISRRDAEAAIAGYEPHSDRSRLIRTGRNVVIADCYNANPSSMAAALANFMEETPPLGADGVPMRKIAVLGDMLELGTASKDEHEGILRLALSGDIKEIYLVGNNFGSAWGGIAVEFGCTDGASVRAFRDSASLGAFLEAEDMSNVFVLIKGSRSVALERTIQQF